MKLYRGALVNVSDISKTPESKVNLESIVGVSMMEIDSKYMGKLLLSTAEFKYACRIGLLRVVTGLLNPEIRPLLLRGELLPMVYELEVNEDDIYEITTRDWRDRVHKIYKRDKTQHINKEVIIQRPEQFDLHLINPRNIARVLYHLLLPARHWGASLNYIYSELESFGKQRMQYDPDFHQFYLDLKRFQETGLYREEHLDSNTLTDMTLLDFLQVYSTINETMDKGMINFLSRFLYSNTGIGEDYVFHYAVKLIPENLFIAQRFIGTIFNKIQEFIDSKDPINIDYDLITDELEMIVKETIINLQNKFIENPEQSFK
jgi:hypothetical protein